MPTNECSRESKLMVILNTTSRLNDKVEKLEILLGELCGKPISPPKCVGKTTNIPCFAETYNRLNSYLNELIERLDKVTSELRELIF